MVAKTFYKLHERKWFLKEKTYKGIDHSVRLSYFFNMKGKGWVQTPQNRLNQKKGIERIVQRVQSNFGKTEWLIEKFDAGIWSKNVIQAYHEYLAKCKVQTTLSFEEYIQKYGYSDDITDLLMSVYRGQGQIIPSDQLEDAIKYLEKKIATKSAKEGTNRVALYRVIKKTLDYVGTLFQWGKIQIN